MREIDYSTPHGIQVSRTVSKLPYRQGLSRFLRELDEFRGLYLSSGYEYPGRYSRWDIVSVRPPLELIGFQREVTFRPLNGRGVAINRMLATVLADHPHWDEFRSEHDNKLAFAGAFGYDLLFQFEPVPLRLERTSRKDLQLFLCDDIIYMDRKREQIERFSYEFEQNGVSTAGLERTGERIAAGPPREPGPITSDHTPEEYMANVETVREGMRQGDYYEVVLRQTFRTPYSGKASELFERVQRASPSPYEFLLQFGDE